MLTPRIGDRARVESIKPGVFDERHRHGAIVLAVSSHREGNTVRTSSRLALSGEGAQGGLIVERLNQGYEGY